MMIPEVPVFPRQMLKVRTQGDELPSRREATENLIQGPAEGGFVGKMLEEVTGEDDVQRSVFHLPSGRTILLQKSHRWIKVFRSVRIEIHREFWAAPNRVDEFSVAAAEVED